MPEPEQPWDPETESLAPLRAGPPSRVPGVSQAEYDAIAEDLRAWERLTLSQKLAVIRGGFRQLAWSDRWREIARGT